MTPEEDEELSFCKTLRYCAKIDELEKMNEGENELGQRDLK
jgi:hypothetical protein